MKKASHKIPHTTRLHLYEMAERSKSSEMEIKLQVARIGERKKFRVSAKRDRGFYKVTKMS